MRLHAKLGLAAGIAGLALVGILPGFQLPPFREYPGVEYRLGEIQLPSDYREQTEWTFARLMYPPAPGGRYGRGGGGGHARALSRPVDRPQHQPGDGDGFDRRRHGN